MSSSTYNPKNVPFFTRRSLFCLLLVIPLLLGLKGLARADAKNLPKGKQQDQLQVEQKDQPDDGQQDDEDDDQAEDEQQDQPEDAAQADKDEEPPWEFSLVPYYENGSTGLVDTANSVEIPFEIKWHSSRVELSLTIPLEIAQLDSRKRLLNNRFRIRARPATSNWYEGIGDILLDGGIDVIEEKKYVPDISFKTEILFPTGNADKGLGVGGFTGMLGIELSKHVVEQFAFNARLYYYRFASPDVIESENYLDYGGGFEIDVTPSLQVSADYDEQTTLVRGQGHPRSIDLTVNYSINDTFEVTAGGEAGLNSAAAKFGFSSGLILHF